MNYSNERFNISLRKVNFITFQRKLVLVHSGFTLLNKDPSIASRVTRINKPHGFTLIEMVVATILVMLAIFSLGVLIPLTQVRSRNTSHQDVAAVLAESMIEKIRVIPWSKIPPDDKSTGKFSRFDGTRLDQPQNNPITINDLTSPYPLSYPPSPYPKISYELMAGEISQSDARTTGVKHYIDYYFKVTTLSYAIPPPNPAAPPAITSNMLKVTVGVYWNESTGEGITHERCFAISSNIYGDQ